MSEDICIDNRFEIIDKAQRLLIESTNITDAPDEMKVLYSILDDIKREMRSLKDERDHWMELAHQWEAGASTRGFAERLEVAASERADVTLFGVDYTALPLDADGVPIHVGDVMENIVCPPVHREVTGVGVECFYGWDEGNGRYSQFDVASFSRISNWD